MDQTEEVEVFRDERSDVSSSEQQDQLTGGQGGSGEMQSISPSLAEYLRSPEFQALVRAIGRNSNLTADRARGSDSGYVPREGDVIELGPSEYRTLEPDQEASSPFGGEIPLRYVEAGCESPALLSQARDTSEAQSEGSEGSGESSEGPAQAGAQDSDDMLVANQEGMEEPQQKVLLTRGIPASGKTTWAKQLVRTDLSWKRVNRDELRRMLFDSSFDPKFEDLVTTVERNMVFMLVMQGFNVVIDACHVKPKYVREWVEFFNAHCPNKVLIAVKDFPIDPQVALFRNAQRPAGERVPDYVIRRMFMSLQNMPLTN